MKSSIKKVKKDWGYELWLVNNKEENYCGKILYINEGCAGSMHFHANKHETFYILEEGDTFVLARLKPHQLIAHEGDVKFLEVSTFHEDSDSYRVWR